MKLRSVHVDQELQSELDTYLKTQWSFEALKAHCLAQNPIETIVFSIALRLDALTAKEINEQKAALTKEAHQKQVHEDLQEDQTDNKLARELNDERLQIQPKLTEIETRLAVSQKQLDIFQTELETLQENLHPVQRQISFLNNQLITISASSVHHHPAGHHIYQHETPESLHEQLETQRQMEQPLLGGIVRCTSRIAQLQREVDDYHQQKNSATTRLLDLDIEQKAIHDRAIERHKRSLIRKTVAGYSNWALTRENGSLLEGAIHQATQGLVNQCKTLQQATNAQCYNAFLIQLEARLDTLKLSTPEKKALAQIITHMREHLGDLALLQQETTTQNQIESSLTRLESDINANKAFMSDLHKRNDLLTKTKIEKLKLKLIVETDKMVQTRNQYAKYALISALLGGITAAAMFFVLQASILTLTITPFLLILGAATLVTPLACLLIMASVAGIRALIGYSQRDALCREVERNDAEMSGITQQIRTIEEDTLPQLENERVSQVSALEAQTLMTQRAQLNADQSLQRASAITPEIRCSTTSPSAFFRPGALPPTYTQLPIDPTLESTYGI